LVDKKLSNEEKIIRRNGDFIFLGVPNVILPKIIKNYLSPKENAMYYDFL
jgi:hypothetical protein